MTKIKLDTEKLLGFRLVAAADTAGEAVVMGGKSGKTMNIDTGEDSVLDAMATSAKFGKEGKRPSIEGAVLSAKVGKIRRGGA